MLFQMLAGVLPFRGDSMSELMYKIANEEAPDIRLVRPELPQALADVVALSLTKRPETRYQTGDQFAADLRNVIAQVGHSAPVVRGDTDVKQTRSDDKIDFMETVPATEADFQKTTIQLATKPVRRLDSE
jgi:serine/threonine-protein kinase